MPPHIEEVNRALRLAERDVIAFETLRDAPRVSVASACFHARQAIEKYIKTVLYQNQIEFRPTHDLSVLSKLLRDNDISLPVTDDLLTILNPCTVDFRFGEETVDPPDRKSMTELVAIVSKWATDLMETN